MSSLKSVKLSLLTQQRLFHQFITKGFNPKKALAANKNLQSLSTNDLLGNLGYIHQTSNAGILHYLPLGERVLQRIMKIIRTALNEGNNSAYELMAIKGKPDSPTIYERNDHKKKHQRKKESELQTSFFADLVKFPIKECELSSLSSTSLWEKTGRFPSDEIFQLKDEKLLLVPTCEEEITAVMKKYITSYKDLPVIMYQISKKYRYEKRPRGGILRGREFYMKDAYSFHSSEDDALQCFDYMNEKYLKIFRKFKIPFYAAWADSGSIGGDKSMEFHYVDEEVGDDKLMLCNNTEGGCGHVSNVEKCLGPPNPEKIGKTMDNINIKWCYDKGAESLVCIYYPASEIIDLKKLNLSINGDKNKLAVDAESFAMDSDAFLSKINETTSEDDLMMMPIVRVIDCRISPDARLPEFELKKYSKFQFFTLDDVDVCQSQEHDICEVCEIGEMETKKSVEVGHIFYLGDKYSKALDLKFTDEQNKQQIVTMGCYGIGVSRLIGAIAQLSKDKHGLRWPSTVAPYTVNFVFDNTNLVKSVENDSNDAGDALLERQVEVDNFIQDFQSKSENNEYHYYDTRDSVSLGTKINASHAVGIPICCVIGGKQVAWPFVEIIIRGKRYGNSYLKKIDELQEKCQWTMIPSNEEADTFEKHIVHKDDAYEVISTLIKDL